MDIPGVHDCLLPVVCQSKALKCRDVEVDEARVAAWWHLAAQLLLRTTGGEKITIFQEVRVNSYDNEYSTCVFSAVRTFTYTRRAGSFEAALLTTVKINGKH